MLRKITLIICLSFFACAIVLAETKDERMERRHQVSALFGDWIMESIFWTDNPRANYSGVGTDKTVFTEKRDYAYTPHIGVEYQYRLSRIVGLGMAIDFQRTTWNTYSYNNKNQEIGKKKENFFNLSFIPTARFTYLHTKYVNLFSSVGIGFDINGGSETDFYGNHTVVSPAASLGFIGASFNKGPWFASVEIGGLYALRNGQTIYMANSRIFTLAIGYRL